MVFDDENYWDEVEGDYASFCTEYGFEWSGTKEDALDLVNDKLRDKSQWFWSGSVIGEPKISFSCEHFVEGNAD